MLKIENNYNKSVTQTGCDIKEKISKNFGIDRQNSAANGQAAYLDVAIVKQVEYN